MILVKGLLSFKVDFNVQSDDIFVKIFNFYIRMDIKIDQISFLKGCVHIFQNIYGFYWLKAGLCGIWLFIVYYNSN